MKTEDARPYKLLVMAGGTGGHVFPGLACASAWRDKGGEVCWMGTQRGIESTLVPEANIKLNIIQIEGVRGKGILGLLTAPFKIVHAIYQALNILSIEKPDVVLGMGGFAAGPGGVAAKLKGIPLIIHEQNAVAGTTNTLLSKIADSVAQAFPGTFPDGKKAITCGNPVRQNIVQMDTSYKLSDKVNVLVVGGSLGALAINKMMPDVYKALASKINVYHQTGKRHIDMVNTSYGEDLNSPNLRVSAFIDDMTEALEWADLVVCRSGAMTVSEVAVAGRPAIFIPYPYAIDDHQSANAKWLVDLGAALMYQEKELSVQVLTQCIETLCGDHEALATMHSKALAAAITNATDKVIDEALQLVMKNK